MSLTTNEYVMESWKDGGAKYFLRVFLFTYIFFCGTGYKDGVWTWKDREMSGIGVRDVKFPKNQ